MTPGAGRPLLVSFQALPVLIASAFHTSIFPFRIDETILLKMP